MGSAETSSVTVIVSSTEISTGSGPAAYVVSTGRSSKHTIITANPIRLVNKTDLYIGFTEVLIASSSMDHSPQQKLQGKRGY